MRRDHRYSGRPFRTRLWILLVLMAVTACSSQATGASPERLTLAVLPDDDPLVLQDRYGPVAAYLEEAVGVPIDIQIPSDYQALVDDFAANDGIDIAVFGGLTYLQAREAADAEPLVMRDIDARFTTAFITGSDSIGESIEDYFGKTLAFGSELSTSGHLMPRLYLENQFDSPVEELFGSVQYTGAHDATVRAVADGVVELGAVNRQVLEQMLDTSRVEAGAVVEIASTPPYVDYVWASRPDLADSLKNDLMLAMVALVASDEEASAILEPLGAFGFLPANDADFALLREVAADLGLLEQG